MRYLFTIALVRTPVLEFSQKCLKWFAAEIATRTSTIEFHSETFPQRLRWHNSYRKRVQIRTVLTEDIVDHRDMGDLCDGQLRELQDYLVH
jgi:hypothetical protein